MWKSSCSKTISGVGACFAPMWCSCGRNSQRLSEVDAVCLSLVGLLQRHTSRIEVLNVTENESMYLGKKLCSRMQSLRFI